MHFVDTQDNGDRCFMAAKADTFVEMRLPAKVVNGLLLMNEKKPSQEFDVGFLKAMLIGFCSMKTIKQNGCDEAIVNLVKELFEWRVGGDEVRLDEFERMIDTAIDGIKKNKFIA